MAEFPKSQFAASEPAEEEKADMAEILRNVILVAIILSVLGVLVYPVIKI